MDSSPGQDGKRQARVLFSGYQSFLLYTEPLLRKVSSLLLLRVELDGMDFVLRTFGPEGCERLLAEVGRRLSAVTGDFITPFQLSQDCFALPLTTCSYDKAVSQGRQLARILCKPYQLHALNCRLEAQVGLSHFPNHARDLNALVRAAAYACHLARERHSGFAIYDSELDERERERYRLMAELDQALKSRSGLQLHFQPLVELASGRCSGVEALCRWRHPELGPISPADFLPYVEQSSLSLPLAEVILDLALQQAGKLRESGFEELLSLNLSPSLCSQPELVARLLEQCRYGSTEAARLCFEFPESGIMAQPTRAAAAMREVRNWGARVLVDDFGSGESSLGVLAELPVDAVKLDQRLLGKLPDQRSQAVVGAIVDLAGKLGFETVAKCVESAEELAACRALGVGHAQGYHIARPMTSGDLLKWRARQSASMPPPG